MVVQLERLICLCKYVLITDTAKFHCFGNWGTFGEEAYIYRTCDLKITCEFKKYSLAFDKNCSTFDLKIVCL
jgi:hypothetical protein